jgi:hypothetical protein
MGTVSEERKANLLNSIKRLQAYEEIQNNMGRCMAAFNFRQADKVLSHFALSQTDVSLEYADEGLFEGANAVKQIIGEVVGAPVKPGEMLDMQLNTPIIEVATDLKTAKALWWTPGAGAVPKENAEPEAIWCWGMLAVDFIYEANTWKIWHLHWFRFIKCSYDKGWVKDTSMINRPNIPVHPLSKYVTYHNPYSPLSVRDGIPACPRPYDTWTDSGWMLNKDKSK